MIIHKKTILSEKEGHELTSLLFVKLAEANMLDEVTINEHPRVFPTWDENWTGKAGTILMDEGKLYRSIHDITNAAQNTKPSATPSMWTQIGDPTAEYPEWIQPIGAHDAYNQGDKASHGGKNWVSTVDGNVWQPGVYGWEVAE